MGRRSFTPCSLDNVSGVHHRIYMGLLHQAEGWFPIALELVRVLRVTALVRQLLMLVVYRLGMGGRGCNCLTSLTYICCCRCSVDSFYMHGSVAVLKLIRESRLGKDTLLSMPCAPMAQKERPETYNHRHLFGAWQALQP